MIIEWVGCSGAGKSTLRAAVFKNLHSSGINAKVPLEIFLGSAISKAVSNERIRNVLLDLFISPWTLISIIKYRNFLKYCLTTLNRRGFRLSLKITLIRSILRKTGFHLFTNKFINAKQVVLVDEGTVQIAHLLFANGEKNTVTQEDLESFCALVPIPDLIIHIMSSESDVMKRTLKRKDKPIAETSSDALKQFICLGHKTFEILKDLNPWPKKTITLTNYTSTNKIETAENLTKQVIEILH